MKTLLDFLPLALFLVAYKLHALFGVEKEEAIYFATPVLMAATVFQMAVLRWIDKKLSFLHQVTLGLILVFGGITLALHDKRFIMWKPSVLYTGMALALAVMLWVMKRNVLKLMLGSQLELPDRVWYRLNIAWIGYALFMALSNAYVALYYSEEDWVSFKVWGYIFPLIFLLGQGLYIAPHLKASERSDTDGAAP